MSMVTDVVEHQLWLIANKEFQAAATNKHTHKHYALHKIQTIITKLFLISWQKCQTVAVQLLWHFGIYKPKIFVNNQINNRFLEVSSITDALREGISNYVSKY